MQDFKAGPFAFIPGRSTRVNNTQVQNWEVQFNGRRIGFGAVTGEPSRTAVIDACGDDISAFKGDMRAKHAPGRIVLRHFASGDAVASLFAVGGVLPSMSPCIADDRFEYWAEGAGTMKMPMSLDEWTAAAAAHTAPENSWVAGLLPDDVLTLDAEDWRAPTEHEIRCVVGEHSFTGITGAAAAQLVGVTPQNFRKYTAADGSASQQKISFAMWHMLLQRLGVLRLQA